MEKPNEEKSEESKESEQAPASPPETETPKPAEESAA
jgi:hypothetical protein